MIVAHLSYLAATIPLHTHLLHLFPHFHLGKADARPHNRVRGKTRRWRFPRAFCDYQLHGLAPLLPLRIVALAHTDKTVTILREQLIRVFLARFEM